ncbi:MAG: hypothetical protein IPJ77_21415 [Planctomycetes bacterium]|nr:hypothetical protein [Planctomycetota bacterium]
MKAGILEVADVLVVNKADLAGADRLVLDIEEAVHIREHTKKRPDGAWSVAVGAGKGEHHDLLAGHVARHRTSLEEGARRPRRARARAGRDRRPRALAAAFRRFSTGSGQRPPPPAPLQARAWDASAARALPGELGLGRRSGRRERWRLGREAQVRQDLAHHQIVGGVRGGGADARRRAKGTAISLRGPPQCGQTNTSSANTRFIRSAQLVRVGRRRATRASSAAPRWRAVRASTWTRCSSAGGARPPPTRASGGATTCSTRRARAERLIPCAREVFGRSPDGPPTGSDRRGCDGRRRAPIFRS